MNLINLVFYMFAAILVGSVLMVITARQPVRGVLFLVLAFFASAVLWMLLQAEFLALVLIFVYVGAVMTLFLFVVMMLNLDRADKRKGWVRYLPLGILVLGLLFVLLVKAISPSYFTPTTYYVVTQPANFSNVKELGALLYTHYFYPVELAAILLLVAIIAAISLTFRGRHGSKAQQTAKQIAVQPNDRLRLINIGSEKK